MIPIPGLETVNYKWITIEAQGYHLHGFLLYTMSDHNFPEYINDEGLGDLDRWTGNNCAIFIVHSPSEQWIEYTKATDHVWWKLFGVQPEYNSTLRNTIRKYDNHPILQIGNVRTTIQDLFMPTLNSYLHGHEISKILAYFDLKETQHPCLILFRRLEDTFVWYVDMSDLVDISERDLRIALKRWFAGKDFGKILQEASNA